MKPKSEQSGVTLTEMTVVIAAVAALTCLGLPAVRAIFKSFESSGSARAVISASLASARAIAAKEQRYAGVRFQNRYHPQGPLKAPQYMIFIVQDPNIMAYGFRAVEGTQPIKLPDTVGVMDISLIGDDIDIDDEREFNNATAFSVIFSPSGKLVIHDVRVSNRDGAPKWPVFLDNSNDDIFNTVSKVTDPVNPVGMFIQDDNGYPGLQQESSRNSFIIYEKEKFRQAHEKGQAYWGYLVQLIPEMIYINPYTGTIIER